MRVALLLLGLVLEPIYAHSAIRSSQFPNDPHILKIATATNWSEVTAQLAEFLPTLVVNEFRREVEKTSFPTIRTFRGELLVTDSSGKRIRIGFTDVGDIMLNGKTYKLDPLATVEAELKHISTFVELKGGFTILDHLFPAAYAAGIMSIGLSSLAYATANTWKAEACRDPNINEATASTCSLMGVDMFHRVAAEGTKNPGTDYKPVSFKCPDQNKNVLEVVKMNSNGNLLRVRIAYDGPRIIHVDLATSDRGAKYIPLKSGNPADTADEKGQRLLIGGVNTAQPVKTHVCESPDPSIRSRFSQVVESNRQAFRKVDPESANDGSSSMNAN